MKGRALRAFSAIAAAATVAGTFTAPPVAASPPPASPATTSPGATVTLVTGDKVTLGAAGSDGVRTMSVRMVRRTDGSQPSYRTTEAGGHQFVIPDDAQPLVATGRLDRALFDVTYLADNGYGDNTVGQLPLIAQFASSVAAAKLNVTADSLAGTSVTRTLASVHASAVRLTKAEAAGFWAQVAPRTRAGKQAKSLAADRGVTKIWLDRKVKASLDQSVPMIGAPQAWAAGYTGKGVKVAVLDTGIDLHHPDFAGKIGATANFTPDASVDDGFGHGTHVASIITGSGAASSGRYRGVAPDAQLVVGKVLPDSGEGPESAVIAGMEWAAAQGAKVVNLSLGGAAPPTYEEDLGAQAVDRLSATTSTLFVIAAGNSGLAGASTVGSPGNATAGLTVGMVTKSDRLDARSSTGPLLRDDHVGKPDISAPGVDIVAAKAERAVIGEPVDDNYTKMSGTSMATPHVAGAAAILAQEHPDWSSQQLKSALMATSKDDGYTVYQQGAGRVDLVRATSQKITGTSGSLDFGRKDENTGEKVDKAAGYRNDGDEPVTLALTATLKASNNADGGAALTVPSTVTVPAHGTAAAPVSLDTGKVGPGIYSGVVVATAAGGVQVRTPIALRVSPPVYPVTIKLSFADQLYAGADTYVYNLDDPFAQLPNAPHQRPVIAPDGLSATLTLPLARGHWMVGLMHQTWSMSNGHIKSYVLVNPEVTVTGPTEVRLDDRDARPVSAVTQRPSQSYIGGFGYRRAGATGDVAGQSMGIGIGRDEAYVTPTKPVTVGKMTFKYDSVQGAPLIRMNVDSRNGKGQPVPLTYMIYAGDFRKLSGTHRQVPIVRVGSSIEPAERPNLRGVFVLMDTAEFSCDIPEEELVAARDAGAAGVLQNDGRMCYYPYGWVSQTVPLLNVDADVADALNALLDCGPVTVTYAGTPDTPYTYRLSYLVNDVPADPTFHVSDRNLASIPTAYHGDQDVAGVASSGVGMGPLRIHGLLVPVYWSYLNKPGRREELVGPVRPGMLWIREASPNASMPYWEERRTPLRAGRMPAENWMDAPRTIGPAEVSPAQSDNNDVRMGWCFACRRDDVLSVVPMYAHADPVVTNGMQSVSGARTTVYADGKPLPTAGNPLLYQLPERPARLKLVTDWDLNTGPLGWLHLYDYGARQHAEWAFTSARSSGGDMGNTYCFQTYVDGKPDPCAVQRLPFLRFQVSGVGITNKIKLGLNTLTVAPFYEPSAHPVTARFRTVSVKLSYDGGKTWQRSYGWPSGGGYRLLFNTPAKATSVSWQVDATDAYGNTVSQTSYDAVGVAR